MKFKNAQEVVVEAKDLFSLPDIFFQLNEMIRNPRYSLADIGDVISKDPALSVRLLKIVNSSYYGFQSKIDTIPRAIVVVGIDDLFNLVVATCVVDKFAKIPTDLVDMTSFWIRSVHCGVVNKLLAKEVGAPNLERLFLVGLLHDIGSLVMYQLMPEQAAKVLRAIKNDRRLLVDIERQEIGFTHADVGGELMRLWALPESLSEVVSCYRNPDSAVVHKFDAKLLNLASRLVDDKELGEPIEDTLIEISDKDFEYLRLNPIQIQQVMEHSVLEFHQVFEGLVSDANIH
ncbi:HDOD domain-containing protein [Methylomonas sp. MgM2]